MNSFAGPFGQFLEMAVKAGKTPLAIIAEDFSNEVLSSLIVNKIRANIAFLPIKAPGYGARRKEMIEDLAALTNAVALSEDKGLTFDVLMAEENAANNPLEVLGKASRVISKQFDSSIVGGYADEKELNDRIEYLKTKAEQALEFDKNNYLERLTKLTGGTAIIKVGGATEIERKEKKDRLDDALSATKSAVQEGIIAGGGSTLYAISNNFPGFEANTNKSSSYIKGFNIVLNAIQSPIRQILINAGVENVDKILAPITFENGYDARSEVYGNLIELGVIDPAKVVRCALENAVSVASLMITTEAGIVDASNKEEESCKCHNH